MKVSIIGGGGRVGSNAAFALQCYSIVSEIHVLDANEQMATGEALDLLHGTSIAGDQKIYAGGYDKCADADLVCITAGLRRKPDESRLDLINRNVTLFRQILDSLKTAGLKKDAIIFVVSNPVDVLTRLAIDTLKWEPSKTIGLGTQLDTARFRSLIAAETNLPPTQIKALILGEHGDSMVPIWSGATVAGVSLLKVPGFTGVVQQKIFDRTKNSGARMHQDQRRRGMGGRIEHRRGDSCDRDQSAQGPAGELAIGRRIRRARHVHECAHTGRTRRCGQASRNRTLAARTKRHARKRPRQQNATYAQLQK